MKSQIFYLSLALIAALLVGSSFFYWAQQDKVSPIEIVAIGEDPTDFGELGAHPERWSQDLADLETLFSAFTTIDTTKTPSEQVASIPPELKVLGASLTMMREQASHNEGRARELATLLQAEAKRAEQFLPIRALAYTHLKLLAQGQKLEIDESGIAPEVKSLSEMVLAPTTP